MGNNKIQTDYLVFDLDGTLLDSTESIIISMNHTLVKNEFPEQSDEAIRGLIGNRLDKIFRTLLELDEDMDVSHLIRDYQGFYLLHGLDHVTLYEGVKETLSLLKNRGKMMGVASYKPASLSHPILDQFELTEFFDHMAFNSADHQTKTKKDLVGEILKKFGNVKAVMIGDSPVDISAGKELSMYTIAAGYGVGTPDILLAEGPDIIINSVSELQYVIE